MSEKCKIFPQDKTVAFIFPPFLTGRKESAEQAKRKISKEAYIHFQCYNIKEYLNDTD